MRSKSKQLALLSMCATVALVLAYAESLLPPLSVAIPGIKLGLPNIAIIFVLYSFGFPQAAAVSFIRIVVISLLFGFQMFPYSMAGAALSLVVMVLLKKTGLFSSVGVSVAGGIFHNVGQILMAMLIFKTAGLGYYLIILAITGTVSGIFIGLCGSFLVKHFPMKLLK